MTTPQNERLKLAQPSGKVTLFELDWNILMASPIGTETYIRRFTPATQGSQLPGVTVGGVLYSPLPMHIEDQRVELDRAPARPKLTVANERGVISSLIASTGLDDLAGAFVTRWQIYAKHLDDGADPDPLALWEPVRYRINQTVQENHFRVVFALAALPDTEIETPKRRMDAIRCPFKYLDATTCGWVPVTGLYFDKDNGALGDGDPLDDCQLTPFACGIRFDGDNKARRFGGFPGLQRVIR